MIRNNSFYKSNDLLNESYLARMKNYFNPYEYNLESNFKDQGNRDINSLHSKPHDIRKAIKK